MGDRFYQQQLDKLGSCPGKLPKTRKRKMAWDTDKKLMAVEKYENASPTPETSMQIVKDIAEELEESVNGVRMILIKAGVYIKSKGAEPSESDTKPKEGSGRVSKDASHAALKAAIKAVGASVDEELVGKLTGKAAQYFTTVLQSIKK